MAERVSKNWRRLIFLPAFLFSLSASVSAEQASPFPPIATAKLESPPRISNLLKPSVYRSVTHDLEVMTHADLADAVDLFPLKNQPALKNYTIYAAMLVHQSLAETRRTLTDYPLYSQMISYVDRTEYSPITHILQLEGGIWKFKLQSSLLMQEKGERQISFRIVEGHFKGMTGNIFFERFDEKSTLVYLGGSLLGRHWPPTFVIERGAEVVFGFTGRKMRTCIETGKKLSSSPTPLTSNPHAAPKNDSDLPQPRNRL